jgi:hypothetical protein
MPFDDSDWAPAADIAKPEAQAAQKTADAATTKADAAQKTADTVTGDLTSFVRTVDKTVDGLQAQIDGSIQTWFYEVAPTSGNAPAVDWTTAALRNNHLGDLYYDTRTGYCYRYQVEDNAYSWQRVTDVDVTKALADAAQAQDTADHKRRVFTSTPTTPYDVGDLWTDGKDLRRCRVEKASAQSYKETDWELATGYTDDTKADAATTKAQAAQKTADAATTKADAAQKTAAATDQHFWADTEGAHVSETGDHDLSGGNVLLTAAKLAIRKALGEVASFSEGAVGLMSGAGKMLMDGSVMIMRSVNDDRCGVLLGHNPFDSGDSKNGAIGLSNNGQLQFGNTLFGDPGKETAYLFADSMCVGSATDPYDATSYPLDNLRYALSQPRIYIGMKVLTMSGPDSKLFTGAEMVSRFGDSSGCPHVYVMNGDWNAFYHPLATLWNGEDVYVRATDEFSSTMPVRVNYLVVVG